MNGLAPTIEVAEIRNTTRSLQPSVMEMASWIILAAVSFQVAYLSAAFSGVIVLYIFSMIQLSRAATPRRAFYCGFMAGMLIAFGELTFFWRIFSAAALSLWAIYSFWLGLFTMAARQLLYRFGERAVCLMPFLWCGLEYFRSELYYLRFSWASPGFAFGLDPRYSLIGLLGTYGVGFLLTAIASGGYSLWKNSRIKALILMTAATVTSCAVGWILQPRSAAPTTNPLRVAGIQLEAPSEKEMLTWLKKLAASHPEAELLILSEYTLDDQPSEALKTWCREHQRYLIVGGKELLSTNFYNTAFVISPEGEVVFRQVKSVPIQFFRDGLPAREQKLWNSPWGKLGICICYDLSYARVTDRLVQLGAQALIVPTMDVADWGKRQHEMHARVGPVRAAEYHIPIFRLASSGISQAISSSGQVLASAPYPGDTAMLSANLSLSDRGRLPVDRWLAPASTLVAAALLLACAIPEKLLRRPTQNAC